MRESHGLSARRAGKTKSRRPKGPRLLVINVSANSETNNAVSLDVSSNYLIWSNIFYSKIYLEYETFKNILCVQVILELLCVSDYLGCFVHSQPRSLFLMQQVISLNTIIMVIDDPTIITMFTFSFVIIFTSFTILFSVEIKRGGSRLSNSSVIVAHDCINGSAYSRELVALSCPCLS